MDKQCQNLSNEELVHKFGKMHGQEGLEAYGIGKHEGKKCIRVIVYRPMKDKVKLPDNFLGFKVKIMYVDGHSRAL